MLRQSPPRLLVAIACCALCLTAGALPAAALPGLDTSPEVRFEFGSWLAHLWRAVEEPVASLFAAEGTEPPPAPTPPTSNAGITIDPDGTPRH